jgi:hypothetical protein
MKSDFEKRWNLNSNYYYCEWCKCQSTTMLDSMIIAPTHPLYDLAIDKLGKKEFYDLCNDCIGTIFFSKNPKQRMEYKTILEDNGFIFNWEPMRFELLEWVAHLCSYEHGKIVYAELTNTDTQRTKRVKTPEALEKLIERWVK